MTEERKKRDLETNADGPVVDRGFLTTKVGTKLFQLEEEQKYCPDKGCPIYLGGKVCKTGEYKECGIYKDNRKLEFAHEACRRLGF